MPLGRVDGSTGKAGTALSYEAETGCIKDQVSAPVQADAALEATKWDREALVERCVGKETPICQHLKKGARHALPHILRIEVRRISEERFSKRKRVP